MQKLKGIAVQAFTMLGRNPGALDALGSILLSEAEQTNDQGGPPPPMVG
ncbi:MAG: hypothetical protein HRT94_00875 [Alphaproteobacteria bacterium]|nr:hypothetical protein [Alphaproteobacteria bacterium]